MKKIVYSIVFIASFLLLTLCCSRITEDSVVREDEKGLDSSLLTRSVVNEDYVEYMGRRYTLTKAPLSLEEAKTLFSDESLEATHYALCVTPSSINQLHELEADASLLIFYHPFGYVLMPENEESNVNEDYDECRVFRECGLMDEDQEDDRILCPIYVLWPVSHPLPSDLQYDRLYEAYYTDSETEPNRYNPIEIDHIAGYLKSYDNRLGQFVPIKNVRLEYQDDLSITQIAYTDSTGYYYLPSADPDSPLVISLMNDKFVIRDSLSTNVKQLSVIPSDYSPSIPGANYNISFSTNFFLDIYKAAEYYFYGHNQLLDNVQKYDTTGETIDIHAINSPDNIDNYRGRFFYTSGNPFIKIWNHDKNNYSGASSKIFGTVNHELGHATHYVSLNSYQFSITPPVIFESFASFFGWYNVLQYYNSIIGSNHSIAHSICTQGRQDWTPDAGDPYTPIYVDLYDDYNQHNYNTAYNEDTISGVSLSLIIFCSLGPTSFQTACGYLGSGVGTSYTSSELATFLSPYSCFLQGN